MDLSIFGTLYNIILYSLIWFDGESVFYAVGVYRDMLFLTIHIYFICKIYSGYPPNFI